MFEIGALGGLGFKIDFERVLAFAFDQKGVGLGVDDLFARDGIRGRNDHLTASCAGLAHFNAASGEEYRTELI